MDFERFIKGWLMFMLILGVVLGVGSIAWYCSGCSEAPDTNLDTQIINEYGED